jgi:hypothetical protein
MKKSIPNIKIVSIIMIKNDYLWRIYRNTEDELMQTIGEDSYNQEFLFHGAKSTPPEKIYKGTEGFNIKFSNLGAYGKGLYFA